MEYRIQGAGCRWSARGVSDAASVHGIVRKHDCALPTLHPKHSIVQGAIITVMIRIRARVICNSGYLPIAPRVMPTPHTQSDDLPSRP